MPASDQSLSEDALTVSVAPGVNRIIFEFRRLVDYDVDGGNIYSERIGEAFQRFGVGCDLIFDYTHFEAEVLSPRAERLYATSASALKALGYKRYVRVVPPRLADYFERYERLVAAQGVDVVTVRTVAEAHAYYDADDRAGRNAPKASVGAVLAHAYEPPNAVNRNAER